MQSLGYQSQTKMMLHQVYQATNNMNVHQARLASGDSFTGRIDNPVDVLKASRAEAAMRGSAVAANNIQDALSFLEIKDSGLQKMEDIGQRLRELTLQYDNDTLSDTDRSALEEEAHALLKEMDHTHKNAKFNDQSVFRNEPLHIQSGYKTGDSLTVRGSGLDFSEGFKVLAEGKKPAPEQEKGKITITTTVDMTTTGNTSIKTEEQGHSSETSTTTGPKKPGSSFSDFVDYISNIFKGKKPPSTETSTIVTEGTSGSTSNTEINSSSSTKGEIVIEIEYDKPVDKKPSPVHEFMNPEFIDQYILDPIRKERTSGAIEAEVFNHRLESVRNDEQHATSHLSRIRDTDVAKEMLALTQQQLLTNVNSNLLTRTMQGYEQHILGLLR